MNRVFVRVSIAALIGAIGIAGLWRLWDVRYRTARSAILITIDTLRPDRLGAYGYAAADTPFLDRFAEQGVVFDSTYTDMPWTTGAMSSVMTGNFGPRHGVRRWYNRLAPDAVTLAEVLRARDFRTGAVVGSFPLDSIYGLDQGFEDYDDTLDTALVDVEEGNEVAPIRATIERGPDDIERVDWGPDFGAKLSNDAYREDDAVTEAAISWLAGVGDERFFLWAHYFGPHEKLTSSEVPIRERIPEVYDADVTSVDSAVGRLLDEVEKLGLAETTLVVVHSDHGQEFSEHGLIGHGHNLYDTSMRVPLIARFPRDIAETRRVSAVTRNVDILPTLLDYLAVDEVLELQGRTLRPEVEGRTSMPREAYMENYDDIPTSIDVPEIGHVLGTTHSLGIRTGPWKFITTRFTGDCEAEAKEVRHAGLLSINPSIPVGARRLLDARCKGLRKRELFFFEENGPGLAPETENRIRQHPVIHAKLKQRSEEIAASHTTTTEKMPLSEDHIEKLKSLGYLE